MHNFPLFMAVLDHQQVGCNQDQYHQLQVPVKLQHHQSLLGIGLPHWLGGPRWRIFDPINPIFRKLTYQSRLYLLPSSLYLKKKIEYPPTPDSRLHLCLRLHYPQLLLSHLAFSALQFLQVYRPQELELVLLPLVSHHSLDIHPTLIYLQMLASRGRDQKASSPMHFPLVWEVERIHCSGRWN
jgi:hypothetical protein